MKWENDLYSAVFVKVGVKAPKAHRVPNDCSQYYYNYLHPARGRQMHLVSSRPYLRRCSSVISVGFPEMVEERWWAKG